MCLPIISCRIWYFDLPNTGKPLLRCITVSLDSPCNLHIGAISWPSICCFIKFTCCAFFCFAHAIASVSFLRCLRFNHCHVISILTFSVSFRNLHLSGFSSHCLLFSSFKRFSNSFGSSTSDSAFSPFANFSSHFLLSLRYFPKLCKAKPFSSFFSCKIQFTFSLQCILLFMVIDLLVLMLILSNSSFLQCNTPAPYLIIPTTNAFIPAITFAPFSCDLIKFFTLLMYSLFTFSFISLFMMRSDNFHLIIRFSLFEPSFAFPRPVLHTFPDQIQYQHYLKKSARSGCMKPILFHSFHTDLNRPKQEMIQFLFSTCYISEVCLIQDYQ